MKNAYFFIKEITGSEQQAILGKHNPHNLGKTT
jgi:hypothetical protein